MKQRQSLGMIVVVIMLAAGCGASRQTSYLDEAKKATTGAVEEGLLQQADELWAQRGDPEKLKLLLQTCEQIAQVQPENRLVLERLAQGYYLLAYGYLEQEEEILEAYNKGAGWAERILGLRPEFRQRIAAGDKDHEALSVTQKEDVPGIYWAYANLGKWSVLKGFATVVKYKSKLKAFIERVHQLDPAYYYNAADRGLGSYYAKAPSFAGGDMGKAKEYFDKALKESPDYFTTKVLMAEYYAVKSQQRPLFEQLLNEVIKADPNVLPDVVSMQKIEQRKAKELLDRADELFE